MKNRNLVFLFVYCFLFTSVKAQKVSNSKVNIVKISCPDSMGYITNIGAVSRALEFPFLQNEKVPDLFYHENLSHEEFYDFAFRNDKSKISRGKLVTPGYVPSIHDFVFCYNKNNDIMFYYILKDSQEQQLLAP